MKKELKLIMCKGLVASGKSTWARDQVKNSKGTIVNICKDDLRAMLDANEHSSGREALILESRNALTRLYLAKNKSVIISDTNFHPSHEQVLKDIAKECGATFEVQYFDTPLGECIDRDKKRENPIGAAAIVKMYNTYIKKPLVQDSTLPKAVICDLDGTLAILTRGPYDETQIHTDKLNESLAMIIDSYNQKGVAVILMSGRKESAREATEQWLKLNNVTYRALHMRATSDNRKDSIVKEELYERHVKDKFYIDCVFDDRLQVVRKWHELGLTVFRHGNPDEVF